jgi:prepilin-type N-terminal cleavage/methylation domain-containing protein
MGESAMNNKGMSLIELIVVIVVLGFSVPVLMTMWSDVSWRSVRSESLADAAFFAQQLMEEIKSKSFDHGDAAPWTASTSFGVEGGENSNNKNTFNDVDDFVGCTDVSVTTPALGYTRAVTIDYVRLSGSAWQGCGAVSACVEPTDCSSCSECCYKRIQVSVSRSNNLASDVSLTTIVGAY